MKITIINGTNRVGNKSMNISKEVSKFLSSFGHDSYIITLENFTELFTGDYINFDNANISQKMDIQNMINADVLFFIVPTYHKGIPAPLKNFLDTLDEDSAFDNKVIGVIASNKSQSFGADQAVQVINSILSFGKLNSFVIPRVNITNHDNIDINRLSDFIDYVLGFAKRQERKKEDFSGYYFGTC